VLDEDPAPLPKGAQRPIFGPYLLWLNGSWIKMPIGTEVGLGLGDFVLDGDPAAPHQKRGGPPISGPCILWPNGSMYQDTTWHSPQFSANVRCGQTTGWTKMPLGMEVNQRTRRRCVRWGSSCPPTEKKAQLPPNFWPMSIVVKRLDESRCHLVRR